MDHDPRASRTPARRVRRLHLRARSRPLVQRGALLVEDALRTASVPAGVLVVRRLDLGRIDPRRAPAALSVRIEDSLRHARARARVVTAGTVIAAERDDRRDSGDAVLFADEVAPCALLALALARGQRPDAWYWPRVVPGYAAALPAARQVAAVLEAAARTRPGVVAVARVLDTIMRQAGARAAGSIALLGASLGALEPAVARRLMAAAPAAGWPAAAAGTMLDARPNLSAPAAHARVAGADSGHAALPALDALPAAWREPVRALVARWPAGDARALWLVAMGLVQARPHAARDPALPARAAALAGALIAHAQRAPATPAKSVLPASGDAGRPRPAGAHGAESRPPVHPARAEAMDETATPDTDRDAGHGAADALPGAEPAIGTTAATDAGGFLFLIRALQHCRMDAWLAEQERLTAPAAFTAWDVPRLVLLRIADLLDIPASDPARLCLLDEDAAGTGVAAEAGVAAETVTATEEDAAVDMWVARVRDWLAAAPGALTLADVVRRPARMGWTRTHVDVFLRARDADLRIRRLGLDLDPGWVPWLARVVTFHYLAAEECS